MRLLLALAIVDGVATSSGIITHDPRGDGSYAVYAGSATLAAWLLAGRRGLLPGTVTGSGRVVLTAAVGALHAQAAIAALKPAAVWPVPAPMAFVLAVVAAVAVGVALLVMRDWDA
jgi:hypothetical protein